MILHRINLYNYKRQEVLYKQYRLYLLISVVIMVPIIVNLLVFCWVEIVMSKQLVRNELLRNKIAIMKTEMKPVYDFKDKLSIINNKIEFINTIETNNTKMISLIQYLDKSVPFQIYLTSLEIFAETGYANFKGIALNPLYIAQFMDSLRASEGCFYKPILRANNVLDDGSYVFDINASINNKTIKLEYESKN